MPSGKAYAAGALAYSLATFNGGYLWHIVLFNEQFLNLKTWSRFDDPSSSLAMVAVALQAVLVTYMLPVFQRAMGVSGALSGARFGLWVAFLGSSFAIFGHTAKNQVSCLEGFIALEGLFFLLQFPLSCALAAFAQERVGRSAAAPKRRA
eukprot:jgi/Undpi1/4856/HiC_scaffold_19.g08209.m1